MNTSAPFPSSPSNGSSSTNWKAKSASSTSAAGWPGSRSTTAWTTANSRRAGPSSAHSSKNFPPWPAVGRAPSSPRTPATRSCPGTPTSRSPDAGSRNGSPEMAAALTSIARDHDSKCNDVFRNCRWSDVGGLSQSPLPNAVAALDVVTNTCKNGKQSEGGLLRWRHRRCPTSRDHTWQEELLCSLQRGTRNRMSLSVRGDRHV
jgi:hypothetical protein